MPGVLLPSTKSRVRGLLVARAADASLPQCVATAAYKRRKAAFDEHHTPTSLSILPSSKEMLR
jgi:hypothetical protein